MFRSWLHIIEENVFSFNFRLRLNLVLRLGFCFVLSQIFGRLWRCTICNKKYASVRGCLSHIESVHENVRLFCPQCGQSTSRKNRLLHHMRHTCRFSKRKLRIAENRRAALKKAAEIRKVQHVINGMGQFADAVFVMHVLATASLPSRRWSELAILIDGRF